MQDSFLIKLALAVKKIFYVFLDISGILLGVFLIILGLWIATGKTVSEWVGFLILFIGICAILIHLGHYYSWKLTRWIFGNKDYFVTRKKK